MKGDKRIDHQRITNTIGTCLFWRLLGATDVAGLATLHYEGRSQRLTCTYDKKLVGSISKEVKE